MWSARGYERNEWSSGDHDSPTRALAGVSQQVSR